MHKIKKEKQFILSKSFKTIGFDFDFVMGLIIPKLKEEIKKNNKFYEGLRFNIEITENKEEVK